jgi:hypothetical protein
MADTGGERLVKVPPQFAHAARIGSLEKYRWMYERSLSDPDHAAHLRKIAADEFDSLGDVSTLADPSVVDTLVKEKKARAGK